MTRKNIILLSAVCGALIGRYAASRAGLPGLLEAFSGSALAGKQAASSGIPWLRADPALQGRLPFFVIAISIWVLFSLYWEIAARNSCKTQSSESNASRGVHVALTNIALILMLFPIRGLGRFVPASSLIMLAGLGIEIMGFCLTIWARRHLGRNWSGRISIKVEHELVRTGPYRFLRHPIYSGLLAMYAGMALVMGERLALLGFFLALFAYWRKIRLEEAILDAAFGPDYANYRREAWAVAPGIY